MLMSLSEVSVQRIETRDEGFPTPLAGMSSGSVLGTSTAAGGDKCSWPELVGQVKMRVGWLPGFDARKVGPETYVAYSMCKTEIPRCRRFVSGLRCAQCRP